MVCPHSYRPGWLTRIIQQFASNCNARAQRAGVRPGERPDLLSPFPRPGGRAVDFWEQHDTPRPAASRLALPAALRVELPVGHLKTAPLGLAPALAGGGDGIGV